MKKYVGKRVYVKFNRKTLRRDGKFSENLNYMGYKKQNMNLQILDVEILK